MAFSMTDGYSARRTLDGVRHLVCFAHARRYFDEATKAQGKADGRARQELDIIGRLYKVEALAKGELPAGRSRVEYTCAVRQQHSPPLLVTFKTWLDVQVVTVLPKSLLGTVIAYARNQWLYLGRYAEDGNAPIDNYLSERGIRPFTTGRKNWLLSAAVAGVQVSAVIYSLLPTCRSCGVEPYAYLRHVLIRLPRRAADAELSDLLPFNYANDPAS